jgi:hypothetical protein
MTGFTYKSYSFLDKDPIIDEIRTVIKDSGVSHKWIEEESGVTAVTLRAWFYGTTKKPQAATINAVARSLGYKLGFVPFGRAIIHIDPPMPESLPKPRPTAVRHIIQMHKYKKKGARR